VGEDGIEMLNRIVVRWRDIALAYEQLQELCRDELRIPESKELDAADTPFTCGMEPADVRHSLCLVLLVTFR
jgi:hypothetical protein